MSTISAVEVRMWGQQVGAVIADPAARCYIFEYASAWRKKGIELAPLLMPVGNRDGIFSFPGLPDTFKQLPGLLSDALPDDFGNSLIDAWMARKGHRKQDITSLDRLSYMGRRGMGALEFKPAQGGSVESAAPIEMKELVEEARNVLMGDLSGDVVAQAALANIIRVGTSAGGARAKAVIAWNPKTHEIRSGQFDVEDGYEHWLLKFDGVGKDLELGSSADYGRIELAYYHMATAAGIKMMPCRLLEENGRAHFMTKRFDRDGNIKHHAQSLCALNHLDYKQRATHAYEQYFIVISEMKLGDEALRQGFLRMAFNVLARNNDDHTKNHGFLLRQGEQWDLAPAYDVTFAYAPKGEWTYQHMMSVNGRFDGITEKDMLSVAERFSVPGAASLLNQVRQAVARWREFATAAGLGEKRIVKIETELKAV